MHELSLCRAIASTATDHAGGRPVTTIRLRIGHFRQVVPDTLRYCWQLHTRGTDLEACRLEVDYVAATVSCPDCGESTTLDQPALTCGTCDGRNVDLVSGEEFLIESIDLGSVDLADEVR